jgi:hypothetical protein
MLGFNRSTPENENRRKIDENQQAMCERYETPLIGQKLYLKHQEQEHRHDCQCH